MHISLQSTKLGKKCQIIIKLAKKFCKNFYNSLILGIMSGGGNSGKGGKGGKGVSSVSTTFQCYLRFEKKPTQSESLPDPT